MHLDRASALYSEASREQVTQGQVDGAETLESMSDAIRAQSERIHTAIRMNESHSATAGVKLS